MHRQSKLQYLASCRRSELHCCSNIEYVYEAFTVRIAEDLVLPPLSPHLRCWITPIAKYLTPVIF